MRILINWDYHRKDLTQAFFSMAEEIDFVYLYDFERPSLKCSDDLSVVYWNDFKSAYDLLNQVKPDKVVFHDIESFYQVALNIAAKNYGIPTLVVEHGIKVQHSAYAKETVKVQKSKGGYRSKVQSLIFYLRAFRLKNTFSLIPFIAFIYYRYRFGITNGLAKCRFSLRKADMYVNFTETNAAGLIERDGLKEEDLKYIGNPNYDDFFQYCNKNASFERKDFYLLIDAPFVEDSNFSMPVEVKNKFYDKLNAFCKARGSRLKVKLHPKSYSQSYFLRDSNIEYITECSTMEYILKAKGCFLIHISTLSPLAILYSKCIFFDTYPVFNKNITALNVVPVLDFWDFNIENIAFKHLDTNKEQVLKETFFKYTDGKATERLRNILLGGAV
ncbi:polysialyltransferase family glycosyltransferase [Cytophagaceae bacterium ABcell3]|nr:polysialyltransferase family glycosyltransferase [Cytophagaceae bacterium ABcell3]